MFRVGVVVVAAGISAKTAVVIVGWWVVGGLCAGGRATRRQWQHYGAQDNHSARIPARVPPSQRRKHVFFRKRASCPTLFAQADSPRKSCA